jgi:hypothetical protein
LCTDILKQTPEQFSTGASSAMKNLNVLFVGVASPLLIIFWGMGMFKTVGTYSDLKRPEVFVRCLVRFLICKEVLTRSFELMVFLYQIAHSLITTAITSIGLGSLKSSILTVPQEVKDALSENNGAIDNVVSLIFILFAAIGIFGAMISIFVSVFSRFFKIYMYEAISPIPISTFGGEATSHIGITFLKSFCGIALQGLLIVISFGIFMAVVASPAGNILEFKFFGANLPLLGYVISLIIYVTLLRTIITGIDQIAQKMMGL